MKCSVAYKRGLPLCSPITVEIITFSISLHLLLTLAHPLQLPLSMKRNAKSTKLTRIAALILAAALRLTAPAAPELEGGRVAVRLVKKEMVG